MEVNLLCLKPLMVSSTYPRINQIQMREFLQLGYNYHLNKNYDQLVKQTELEMLFCNIVNSVKKGFVSIDDSLKSQLSAERYIRRGCKNSTFLPQRLLLASKRLKANQDIVIRKANKYNTYVIFYKSNYFSKISNILSDDSKF